VILRDSVRKLVHGNSPGQYYKGCIFDNFILLSNHINLSDVKQEITK